MNRLRVGTGPHAQAWGNASGRPRAGHPWRAVPPSGSLRLSSSTASPGPDPTPRRSASRRPQRPSHRVTRVPRAAGGNRAGPRRATPTRPARSAAGGVGSDSARRHRWRGMPSTRSRGLCPSPSTPAQRRTRRAGNRCPRTARRNHMNYSARPAIRRRIRTSHRPPRLRPRSSTTSPTALLPNRSATGHRPNRSAGPETAPAGEWITTGSSTPIDSPNASRRSPGQTIRPTIDRPSPSRVESFQNRSAPAWPRPGTRSSRG